MREGTWTCARCGPVALQENATYRSLAACPRCGDPVRVSHPELWFRCPACTALLEGTATRCISCGHALGAPHCEACGGAIPEDEPTCPACGALASRESVAPTVTRPCPTCALALQPQEVDGALVEHCAVCEGIWLSHDTLDHWTEDRASHAPHELPHGAGTPPPADPRVRYRPCPACRTMMNRVNFAPGVGVIVDVCKAHGVWLDAGELEMILHFAATGRLDVARRREAEARRESRAAIERSLREVATTHRWMEPHEPRGFVALREIGSWIGRLVGG